ncbi:hypothetical protein FA10DRAFT_219182, partial [Acaromyces ingoldii]
NAWEFWSKADPTHGQVQFVDQSTAKSQNLIGNDQSGAAFMRVSDKDLSGGGKRESVRFQSKTAYDTGLIIFDVVKMPVGCSTWPALWTTKGSTWPTNGEIDVLEGVGYTSGGTNQNLMTVHLNQDSPLDQSKIKTSLGKVQSNALNCNQHGGGNTGCAYRDSNKNGPSWGQDFNQAGGGIWAMQFGNGNGVKIWFWGRQSGKIPAELQNASKSPQQLDPSKWPSPMADFQATAVDQMVEGQNIIMDITLGGDWAGS